MTVCIAAVTESKNIIGVTDKMLSMANPIPTTFEVNESNKVSELDSKTLALFAGDVTHANEILKRARMKLRDSPVTSIFESANIVNDSFKEYWESTISNFLEMRYKISLETFMQNQNAFDPELIKYVNDLATKFSIDVQILVAGVDTKPRIYYIDNEGSVVERTSIGYACIGSGQQHASLSMIESEYSKSFSKSEAIYTLLQAKKRAEYDPGVGEKCDIAIIDGKFKKYSEETVEEINSEYEKSKIQIKESIDKKITDISKIKGI